MNKICKYCGKEFETTYPQKNYCSDKCYTKAKLEEKKYIDKICKNCGKKFKTRKKHKVYCNKNCAIEAKRRWGREYMYEWRRRHFGMKWHSTAENLEKLKEIAKKFSPNNFEYQKKNFCEVCGSKRNLHTHHNSYNPPKLITLCKQCHFYFHRVLLKQEL